ALRQRFGRLNRAGRPIPAAGSILVTAEGLRKKVDDPVYGSRIRETWDALTAIARRGRVDFGVSALDARLRKAKIDMATIAAPRARAPVLMPAYFDLWAQTSPPPAADPEVGLFLHGVERAPAEVSLVWRSDTSSDMFSVRDKLIEILELVPPRTAEMVSVPIWAAAGWLRRWNTARAAQIADVPGREEDLEEELSETNRRAFRWAGADDPRTGPVDAGQLRPGDVLVVPADYGGCDEYGWAPASREPVTDVAAAAAWPFRGRRLAVRVTPAVPHWKDWERIAAVLADTDAPSLDELLAVLPEAEADEEAGEDDTGGSVREQLEALRGARRGKVEFRFPYGPPAAGAVVVAWHGVENDAAPRFDQPVTEDDTLSHTSDRPVSLQEHTGEVVACVERFTAALRLDRYLAADLSLAARLHDAGKADARFQLLLAGGDRWNRPAGAILAKSGRLSPRGAWKRAGLLPGWRHEAASVRLATDDPRFAGAYDPYLVLWLVGTHHGLGRPFFGFFDLQDDQGPQSLAYTFRGDDWATLFEQLKRRYGVWGLARLETILRLADHRASEAERPA
ncbi:MAG: HD domain-containing protein, partial [Spirochaetaceae bacterium]|nr:HD domain-containing protein [Spirochaetaceae bacterium]